MPLAGQAEPTHTHSFRPRHALSAGLWSQVWEGASQRLRSRFYNTLSNGNTLSLDSNPRITVGAQREKVAVAPVVQHLVGPAEGRQQRHRWDMRGARVHTQLLPRPPLAPGSSAGRWKDRRSPGGKPSTSHAIYASNLNLHNLPKKVIQIYYTKSS